MSKELEVKADGQEKKFKISPIENGIVIDHIPAGMADKVVGVLKLTPEDQVMIGKNFKSRKTGKKDVVKVEDYSPDRLTQEIIDKIAVICRNAKYPATICLIINGKKVKKITLELPKIIVNVIKCFNPKCVTVIEGHTVLEKRFKVIKNEPLVIKCDYCERKMREQDILLL